MSTQDPHAGTPAPWHGEPLPSVAVPQGWDDHAAGQAGPAKGGRLLTVGVILRALKRHWWQILLAWGVTSAALVMVIHSRVKPTYEAVAYVQIDPQSGGPILPNTANFGSDVVSQLETQAARMMTTDVLGVALLDREVAKLPRIRNALDAQAELRREVRVQIIPKTRLVSVSMAAPTSAEAVTIVNAVARAYENSVAEMAAADIRNQTRRLETALAKFKKDHATKADELRKLVPDAHKGEDGEADGADGDPLKRARGNMSMEEFRLQYNRLEGISSDLEVAEKKVDHLKATLKARQGAIKLDEAVEEAVHSDPAVMALSDRYAAASAKWERARKIVTKMSDPAVVESRKVADSLREEGRALIARKRAAFRKQLQGRIAGEGDRELKEAEDAVEALRTRQETLAKRLKDMKVQRNAEAKLADRDNLEIKLAEQELSYIRGVMETVERNLQAAQLDAEIRTNKVHVILAEVSNMPSTDNSKKLMAAAPIGMMAAVMSLFVVLEVVGGRVANPDDLSSRLQLGVIGVVPPLPSSRSARAALPWGNEAQRSQRRLDEFVQSLDHLRVQIWSGRGAGAGNRCILITSACVSEGKSTLAAQLAGRCANAGLTTLLVDADLRRPSQARLLDISAEPGLADVLSGQAEPEDAMVVVGHAGGFHLLPAGAPVRDPSQLLHGSQLGTLMARFRETFDIVIVDAPPVLAVPDALVLGRWTDGAVLAVRHDTSRFPLVERARQKLASVGVPILGAVVNGVRSVDSTYSNYAYTPAGGTSDAEGASA